MTQTNFISTSLTGRARFCHEGLQEGAAYESAIFSAGQGAPGESCETPERTGTQGKKCQETQGQGKTPIILSFQGNAEFGTNQEEIYHFFGM